MLARWADNSFLLLRFIASTILLVQTNKSKATSRRLVISATGTGNNHPRPCFSSLSPTASIRNEGNGLLCLKLCKCKNENEDKFDAFPLNHLLQSTSRIISQNSYRIDSQAAASIIHDVYTNSSANDKAEEKNTSISAKSSISCTTMNRDEPTLIIITSDASRGSKRLLGLSTIIRTIYTSPKSLSTSTYRPTEPSQIVDTVTMATRRRQSPTHHINIVDAEIAAIALGLKLVLQQYPSEEQRKRVLVVSDCEGALQFFCGANISGTRSSNVNGKQNHISSSTIHHPHYRLWKMIQHPTSSKEFLYRDSIWDMRWAKMTKVKSAHLGISGFFDHEVADILSSYAKGVSNKEAQELGLLGSETNLWKGEKTSKTSAEAITNSNTMGRQIEAPRLSLDDLVYLASKKILTT